MVFAGEASWRWRMGKPATDTTYETIWRQMARWLTAAANGPVNLVPMAPSIPGSTDRVVVTVKNAEFQPVADADVVVRVTGPDQQTRQLSPALSSPQDGRYTVAVRFEQAGVYRIEASASQGETRLGTSSRQVLVGGADLEMSQPRLNESVLRRLARETGGRYLNIGEADALDGLIRQLPPELGEPEVQGPLAQWMEPAADHRVAGGGMDRAPASRAWRREAQAASHRPKPQGREDRMQKSEKRARAVGCRASGHSALSPPPKPAGP